jgi:hypothetical protein
MKISITPRDTYAICGGKAPTALFRDRNLRDNDTAHETCLERWRAAAAAKTVRANRALFATLFGGDELGGLADLQDRSWGERA